MDTITLSSVIYMCLVFHTSNRAVKYPNLKINNAYIGHVYEFNFLGVIFNSHMNWSNHIIYVITLRLKFQGQLVYYNGSKIYILSLSYLYYITH